MQDISQINVMARIVETAPLFLTVPAAFTMIRVYHRLRLLHGMKAAWPFLALGVLAASSFIMQGLWILFWVDFHAQEAMWLYAVSQVFRSAWLWIALIGIGYAVDRMLSHHRTLPVQSEQVDDA